MLDPLLIPLLQPPLGRMLVERLEMPERYGSLWLPDGYRGSTRSAYARVINAGAHAPLFRQGEMVMLGVNVNRAVSFGWGDSERTIWICTKADVLCRILKEPQDLPERSDVPIERGITTDIKERGTPPDNRFEEADPRGLR